MKNELPRKTNGMPNVGLSDLNDFAISILQDSMPQVLESPMALDVNMLLEDILGIGVQESRMAYPFIYGCLAFSKLILPIDKNDKERIDVPNGTLVLNKTLHSNTARRRFTEAHEAARWLLHREYMDKTEQKFAFCKGNYSYISGKNDSRELGRKNPRVIENDDEVCEWQADNLAAALLMPGPTFIPIAKALMDMYGFTNHQLVSGSRVREGRKIVKELAEIFKVSERSVRIRLRTFGMYVGDAKR